jgi:hypothetical protein
LGQVCCFCHHHHAVHEQTQRSRSAVPSTCFACIC